MYFVVGGAVDRIEESIFSHQVEHGEDRSGVHDRQSTISHLRQSLRSSHDGCVTGCRSMIRAKALEEGQSHRYLLNRAY